MACVFDKCCGCIELRSGCLIIGYLNLVFEIIVIVTLALGMLTAGVVSSEAEDGAQTVGIALLIIFGIMLLLILIFFTFTIVLLVGLHQNKPTHIKVYLVFVSILLVLGIIMFFASFAGTVSGVSIATHIFSILLQIYFLLVIRSYYLQISEPSKRGAIYRAA